MEYAWSSPSQSGGERSIFLRPIYERKSKLSSVKIMKRTLGEKNEEKENKDT